MGTRSSHPGKPAAPTRSITMPGTASRARAPARPAAVGIRETQHTHSHSSNEVLGNDKAPAVPSPSALGDAVAMQEADDVDAFLAYFDTSANG